MSQMSAFCHKTKTLRLLCALLLIALSGCSLPREVKLYVKNDSAHPMRVGLRCAEGLPQDRALSLLLPHSEQEFNMRLEFENSYELEVFNTGESSWSLPIPQNLLEDAGSGEIDVVLGNGEPRLTANPDRDVVKAQQKAFRFTVAFLAAFASVIYWSKYWRRRRTRA